MGRKNKKGKKPVRFVSPPPAASERGNSPNNNNNNNNNLQLVQLPQSSTPISEYQSLSPVEGPPPPSQVPAPTTTYYQHPRNDTSLPHFYQREDEQYSSTSRILGIARHYPSLRRGSLDSSSSSLDDFSGLQRRRLSASSLDDDPPTQRRVSASSLDDLPALLEPPARRPKMISSQSEQRLLAAELTPLKHLLPVPQSPSLLIWSKSQALIADKKTQVELFQLPHP